MTELQFPITRAADLDFLDGVVCVEGYTDGFRGAPLPALNGNRPLSYVHGWWNGAVDGGHVEKPAWMAELAADAAASTS